MSDCRRAAWLAILMVSSTALGCKKPDPRSSSSQRAKAVLLVDGCAELRAGNLCELGKDRRMVAWTAANVAVRVAVDQSWLETERVSILGGRQVRFQVPRAAKRIVFQVGQRFHTFRISAPRGRTALDAIQSEDLSPEGTRARLDAMLQEAVDPELRAHALALYGRSYLRSGDYEEACQTFERSRAAALRAGLPVQANRELFVLASTQMQQLFRLREAEATLDRVVPAMSSQEASLLLQRAALFLLEGDTRKALSFAREALDIGERLDLTSTKAMARDLEQLLLAELGRLDDARALEAQLVSMAGDDPCWLARLRANQGWIELSTAEGDAARALEKSREAVRLNADCSDRFYEQNALVNVGLAHFRLGQLEEARTALAQAAELGELAGWVRAWAMELEGRLALATGEPKRALALFEDLQERGRIAAPVSMRYRAAVGVGLAHAKLGKLKDAVAAFREAEAQLDEDARLVPLAEGRDVFVGEREESSRELLEALLKLDRADDAFAVARHARARALQTLITGSRVEALTGERREQWIDATGRYKAARKRLEESAKNAWEVPRSEREAFELARQRERALAERALDETWQVLAVDEAKPLRPPAAGELLLAFHPLPEGWAVFGATAQGVEVQRVAEPLATADVAALSAQLLAPFAAQIEQAERLTVLPYGGLKALAFHALPWGDATLLDARPVAYGTDLGAPEPGSEFPVDLMVIADPRNNLPDAQTEARLVATRAAVAHEHVLLGALATPERVSKAFTDARAVHFAGHAEADARGFRSRMLLADGGELLAGDILMLPRVPHTLILSGCETTRESQQAPVSSVGLAQAFLARGAQLVVATTAPVADSLGLAFARALYADGRAQVTPESFRRALLSVRGVGNDGWMHYRLLVP
jgi:tetratricopeptide (TPR) repeat protein